jgi:hypothetical protein
MEFVPTRYIPAFWHFFVYHAVPVKEDRLNLDGEEAIEGFVHSAMITIQEVWPA